MRLSFAVGLFAGAATSFAAAVATKEVARSANGGLIAPKVFIISMFVYEQNVWFDNDKAEGSIGSLLAQNITVPGFSPLFPDAHCTASGEVCQLTTGEAEINAAATISALVFSNLFNLTDTYFLIAGIAGISPKEGTTGSVAFSKYAIQVALQYEFDAREMPESWNAGYFPQGATAPDVYPGDVYGTEVFEVNEALMNMAVQFANSSASNLSDNTAAQTYRENFSVDSVQTWLATTNYSDSEKAECLALAQQYVPATKPPSVITCDTATSDVYFSGVALGEAFENTTKLFTNGSGTYCMTAQEDNATLEVLLRAALHNLVDFSRIIIMRTASDFDRPYPGISAYDNLITADQGGFDPAIENIYIAGVKVVQGILDGWTSTFKAGVPATNYIGDVFGSLGGDPDFGPGYITEEPAAIGKRGVGMSRMAQMAAKRGMSKHR